MIDLPLQLILLSLPSFIFVFIRKLRGHDFRGSFREIGWRGCQYVNFLWGLGLMVITGGLGFLALQVVPTEALQDPRVNVSSYSHLSLTLASFIQIWLREAFYTALGEEIFFRGFLESFLERKLGFAVGNLIQAFIFLLPHFLLLLVNINFWPLLIVQGITGWLLGFLRSRSGSILPGWLAHSLANALSALLVIA